MVNITVEIYNIFYNYIDSFNLLTIILLLLLFLNKGLVI
jgi:hypothetical protein